MKTLGEYVMTLTPREVLRTIDVEGEGRIVDDRRLEARGTRALDRRLRRDPERGLEQGRVAKRERVYAAVVRRREGDRPRDVRERIERGCRHAWTVGHDDERTVAGARVCEPGGDRVRMACPRVLQDLDAVTGQLGLGESRVAFA